MLAVFRFVSFSKYVYPSVLLSVFACICWIILLYAVFAFCTRNNQRHMRARTRCSRRW